MHESKFGCMRLYFKFIFFKFSGHDTLTFEKDQAT